MHLPRALPCLIFVTTKGHVNVYSLVQPEVMLMSVVYAATEGYDDVWAMQWQRVLLMSVTYTATGDHAEVSGTCRMPGTKWMPVVFAQNNGEVHDPCFC